MSGAVVVFARAPRRGEVKTRLEPLLGPDRTLRLYQAFLQDTLDAARRSGARVLLAHTHDAPPEAALAHETFPQRGATFGERFDHALADARARLGASKPVVLIGADTPHLGPHRLAGALATLRAAPSVLGPSPEGGFHLVGFADRVAETKRAFDRPNDAANLARILHERGLPPILLEAVADVDVPSDLVELVLHLDLLDATRAPWRPEGTVKLLSEWGARVERDPSSTRGARLLLDV